MKLGEDREAVRRAEQRLAQTRVLYHESTHWLHGAITRHRAVGLVGGGILAGLILGRLPLAKAGRAALSIATLGLSVLKTPLGAMAFGALLGKGAELDDEQKEPGTAAAKD